MAARPEHLGDRVATFEAHRPPPEKEEEEDDDDDDYDEESDGDEWMQDPLSPTKRVSAEWAVSHLRTFKRWFVLERLGPDGEVCKASVLDGRAGIYPSPRNLRVGCRGVAATIISTDTRATFARAPRYPRSRRWKC